jgi:ubiquinone/menaquinone biosynthesis C-methylase UbiE
MAKKRWKKKKRGGKNFWDHEYKEGEHLALSMNPSEDLEKFVRWIQRGEGNKTLNVTCSVLDIGCGNGRNLIGLARAFGVHGTGFDISTNAIKQAAEITEKEGLQLQFEARSMAEPLPLPDESQSIVLDMMVSHFLNESKRLELMNEIHRVLKPGGYFFYKTFLLDEDQHAYRLIKEHGTDEKNTYIHPEIGVPEHVSTEEEIEGLYGQCFTIHRIQKSHRHKGKHGKRRSISVYMLKI